VIPAAISEIRGELTIIEIIVKEPLGNKVTNLVKLLYHHQFTIVVPLKKSYVSLLRKQHFHWTIFPHYRHMLILFHSRSR